MAQGLMTARRERDELALVDQPEPRLDPSLFRDAMAQLAGGVAIVSCWDGAAPSGLLISSITALSTEPPRMLFCVRKAASAHGALLRGARCGLAVLSEHDRLEADRFSRSDRKAERFGADRWALESPAPPRLRRSLIGLDGVISHRIDAGTHTIFITDIYEVRLENHRPLIYFDRDFRKLRSADELVAGLESLSGVTVWSPAAANGG